MNAHSSDPQAEALAHLKQANAFREQGDLQNALLECEIACQLTPKWTEAHYLRGLLLEALDRNDEASEAFRQTTSLNLSQPPRKDQPAPPGDPSEEYPSVPWTNRDAWWGLGMAIGLTFLTTLILVGILAISSSSEDTFLSLWIPLQSLIWLVPVWWFVKRKYGAGLDSLGFRGFSNSMLGIGCGMLIAFYVIAAIYSGIVFGLFDSETQPDLAPIAEELSIPWLLPLTAVLVAPIVEEIFFRGFLFAALRQRYNWKKGALISSATFGIIHLQPLAFLPLTLLGFLFAYLYHRSGSIWLPISMHFLINTLAVIGEFIIESD